MEVKDFERIRVGSGYPACIDVAKIGSHESYGVYGQTYNYTEKGKGRIQLRQKKDGDIIALFHFKFDNFDLPKGWEDSELLWSNISTNEVNDDGN